MGTVSGGWMRANVAVNPMFSDWTTVDPRHSADEPADSRRSDSYQATAYQPAGNPVASLTPTPDASEPVDHTPTVHGGTAMNPGMGLAELGAVHTAPGLGAHLAQTQVHPRFMPPTDAYRTTLVEDMPATPIVGTGSGRLSLIRGLNGYPENNPPKEMYGGQGYRRAYWAARATDHNLALPTRRHRFRVTRRMVAQSDVSTPPPADGGGPYNIAWPSLAKVIQRNFARPRMRRTPGRFGEAVMTDGTEGQGVGTGAQVGAWV